MGVDVIEIRNNADGTLDEIVAPGFHLEQMADGHWWMEIGGVHVNLHSKKPIEAIVNDERGLAAPTAPEPDTAGLVDRLRRNANSNITLFGMHETAALEREAAAALLAQAAQIAALQSDVERHMTIANELRRWANDEQQKRHTAEEQRTELREQLTALRREVEGLRADLNNITKGCWDKTSIDASRYRACQLWSKIRVKGEPPRPPCHMDIDRAALAQQAGKEGDGQHHAARDEG